MKYLILLCDGMADLPLEEIGGITPMEAAKKPMMDSLAKIGYSGMVKTVPDGVLPGSDTANMSVMGYDPVKYYTGRSPIEAVSMGIEMSEDDVAFRTNLVTLSDDSIYSEKIMIDYSSDEITTAEACMLIDSINKEFADDGKEFYCGKSYRHCMLWKSGPLNGNLTPPHDILTRKITDYLPKEPHYLILKEMMEKSYDILKDHPVNISRMARGLRPANSLWIWGQGKKPALPKITEKYNIRGSVITAVDLIFGLGICAGLDTIEVEGATGTIHTNFEGKANAAINEFEKGQDYVYLHIEAPDECGHRRELENKIRSIELIDEKVLTTIYKYFEAKKVETGEDFRILILPDHPTPISLRTHTSDPVPFVLYSSDNKLFNPVDVYSEKANSESGVYIEDGTSLFDLFIRG